MWRYNSSKQQSMCGTCVRALGPIVVVGLALFLGACEVEQDADVSTQDTAATMDTAMVDPAEADTAVLAAAGEKINLNAATEDEFRSIPNVGDRMIGEFIEYRPYVSIRQFRQEIGKYVDEQQVATYEQYVYVPINPNESDEATLQQIPGVNEAVAAELAEGRPYSSDEAFLEALRTRLSPDQVAVAERYLEDQ